jgi:uncharacterized protein (DUF2141 family)
VNRIILSIIFIVVACCVNAQDLTVKINGISKIKGTLYVRIYTENQDFGKDNCLIIKRIKVAQKSEICTFNGLKSDKYAVFVYQDKNDNGKFDKNFKVIPAEPYGLSNNPKIFGRPKFEQCSFSFSTNAEINIEMK